MFIREAIPEDNDKLQAVQARCLYGTNLVVTTVNTPDFFARAKAYAASKVFVACEDDQILGSAACALRDAVVNGKLSRVGYEFQYFTSPDHRRKGIGVQLHQQIENHLIQQGAGLSYLVVIEGNLPAMRLFEAQGFGRHRTLLMPTLLVYKEMDAPLRGKIRPAPLEDLGTIAELLNETWRGFELYEPASAEGLARFVRRTPAYSFDNLLLLEEQGHSVACLGYWDWSRITRITVQAANLGLGLQVTRVLLDLLRHFRPMPRVPRAGDTLKQWVLTPVAFRDPEHLAVLLRQVNNLARQSGVEQIMGICEKDHAMLQSMKSFFHTDIGVHLYVKSLQQHVFLSDQPVFVNGIDL